jgi:hypothetical protein
VAASGVAATSAANEAASKSLSIGRSSVDKKLPRGFWVLFFDARAGHRAVNVGPLIEGVVNVIVIAMVPHRSIAMMASEGQRARMHRDLVGAGVRDLGARDLGPCRGGERDRSDNQMKTCGQGCSFPE